MTKTDFAEANRPPLWGVLAEFRTALEEEIKAASRNVSSNATTLTNGRRIAHVASSFQYVFTADTVLTLPADTPAKFLVEGKVPLNATVISCEGLTLTISLPVDLGSFVPLARLQTDLTFLLQKLIERIEEGAAKENPGGRRLLGDLAVTGKPIPLETLSNLYTEQRQAAESALGRDTTFIWGPPGTGKTWTIGAIVAECYKRKQSVLVVSHTNTAVDEALLKAADRLAGGFETGELIRIGEPRKEELRDRGLLLEEIALKREAELAEERQQLLAARQAKTEQLQKIQKDLALCEWTRDAETDFAEMVETVAELQRRRDQFALAKDTFQELLQHRAEKDAVGCDAQKARALSEELASLISEEEKVSRQLKGLEETCGVLQTRLVSAEAIILTADRLEPLRQRRQELPTGDDLRRQLKVAQLAEIAALNKKEQTAESLKEAEAVMVRTSTVNRLTRAWRGLPDPDQVSERIKKLAQDVESAAVAVGTARDNASRAEALLHEVVGLEVQLQQAGNVPRPAEVRERAEGLRLDLGRTAQQCEEKQRRLNEALARRLQLENVLHSFELRYGVTPNDALRAVESYWEEVKEATARLEELRTHLSRGEALARETLRVRVEALQSFGLIGTVEGSPEEMLENLQQAFQAARSTVSLLNEDELRSKESTCQLEIAAIQVEVDNIDEELQHVEETLIAEARVIATTLTRAYLRDTVQKRRFDTVILDEASMAPIPALWIAAGLATRSVVVVGDPKQLPPIVQSSHDLAKKWLGRDIFDVSGVLKSQPIPGFVVELLTQNRMHPAIASIPNSLIYAGKLRDGASVASPAEREKKVGFDTWYKPAWELDSPVLLIDTESTGAWVTSVPRRGPGSSRLNFLSATICVDIVEQILHENRPEWSRGHEPRILIACPYRPHAKLLQLLLREHGLEGEVSAGTAHSFQGSEADVVILDLVNDEPHWRVGMFNPANDENSRQLLNVALTRARHRLIVVGDFEYAQKMGKRSFLGGQLVPYLVGRFARCDALEFVPAGLSARAARAQTSADSIGPTASAGWMLVTQEEFWPLFIEDLSHAKERIVIYSAFLRTRRVESLSLHIRAAVERGVHIWLVTKTLAERGKAEVHECAALEEALRSWGVVVVHKQGMHEKVVLIDRDILWSGSLNVLSHSRTQEIVERRQSQLLVTEYASTLRLNELIGEILAGEGVCPICGNEVVAAEGRDEPFFWRCVEDGCYSRSVGQPRPQEGLIVCRRCPGALEYEGEYRGHPSWRCKNNHRHHQRIVRSHLRLPKMRELIPRSQLRKLDKTFGLEDPNHQLKLF